MVRVSIVLVNWNSKASTLECLESIQSLNLKEINLLTIVVDNGSTDGSLGPIQQKFPKTKIIETGSNLGFSKGSNIGIVHGLNQKSDYIWLLNNDTVVHKLALQELIKGLSDLKAGIAGSKIYFYPKREFHFNRYSEKDRGKVLWYAGGTIDWFNLYAFHRGVDEIDSGQYDEVQTTDFVSGCSMFVKAEIFKRIGFLDELFYLYLEDVDFCIRAKKTGWALLFVPKSIIWHKNSGSSGVGSNLHQYYMTRNRLLVGMRYASLRTKVALLREGLAYILRGPAVRRKAILHGLLHRYGRQTL